MEYVFCPACKDGAAGDGTDEALARPVNPLARQRRLDALARRKDLAKQDRALPTDVSLLFFADHHFHLVSSASLSLSPGHRISLFVVRLKNHASRPLQEQRRQPAAKPAGGRGGNLDEQLTSASLRGPTLEGNSRIEVHARLVKDGSKIFVYTSYRNSAGSGHLRVAKRLVELINTKHLTKRQVLAARDEMQQGDARTRQ